MRIRILDPGSALEKMDPDPGYFFKIYWVFFNKAEFSNYFLLNFFFAYFYAKLYKAFRNQEMFIISLFQWFKFGFGVNILLCSFWLIFCSLDPDPGSRIFLRIRIQEAKIFRIQRIRILSTAPQLCSKFVRLYLNFFRFPEFLILILFLILLFRHFSVKS